MSPIFRVSTNMNLRTVGLRISSLIFALASLGLLARVWARPESVIGSTEFDAWFADALGAYFEHHRDHVFTARAESGPRDAKLAIALLMAAVEAAAKVTSLRGDPEDAVVDELTHMVLGYVL